MLCYQVLCKYNIYKVTYTTETSYETKKLTDFLPTRTSQGYTFLSTL